MKRRHTDLRQKMAYAITDHPCFPNAVHHCCIWVNIYGLIARAYTRLAQAEPRVAVWVGNDRDELRYLVPVVVVGVMFILSTFPRTVAHIKTL